jgi:hypothetical protein
LIKLATESRDLSLLKPLLNNLKHKKPYNQLITSKLNLNKLKTTNEFLELYGDHTIDQASLSSLKDLTDNDEIKSIL